MTSSMLSGERRWASARRGGMTVLGKVAVPKPINLPSQRLENHGMDPNVEIVPKGTHGWGSKSSSSSSNAWGSPNTDGGTGSPSFLSGRPSSGGTGTRPSTAGSDRAHDQVANAWGSSSRPSSSSGVLTSNQTSQTALRPHSAETRPGSSQLSRFAEPLSDNSGAWGGSGTSEKLGVTPSKNDGFSLSTGDFPSLGSEKENTRKNTDSQDHGSRRPGSSSGAVSVKEHADNSAGDFSSNALGAGSWRKESSMYGEEGARSNVEKWHADPQPYPNSNIHHSQQFDSWHGPPVNNHPGGVWYRGPPGGPPFGSPAPPGGFPMEPFPYFHPQMPPPPFANPQPVRPPNTAPRSSHPQNGDMYRPQMHDAYVRPGMPLRPGFYPGPVPYDNYYGPPMGYCNSNERDAPFMGMAMGPAGYNRYPGHNVPDPGNSLGRTSGHGPTSNPMVSEQVEAVHPQDARGPYKVLLKQHGSWEGRDEEHRWDGNRRTNSNRWRTDDRMDDEMDARKMILDEGTSSYEAVDNRAVPLKVKSPENIACQNLSEDGSFKKFELPASNFPEVTAPKDSRLVQKIEGINAKSRACDVRQDVKSVSTRKSTLQGGNMMTCHPDNAAFSHEKACGSGITNSAPHEDHFSVGCKSFESTIAGGTTTARKSTHGKADHHGKMRFNNKEVDGWNRKTNVHSEVSHASREPEINCAATQNVSGKDDGDSILHVSDANESQHAKMTELAKRIKQREKEEEERTRDQRAKALAKLEELNRRTQAGESVAEKVETVASNAVQNKLEGSLIGAPPVGSSHAMIAQSAKDEKSASTMSNLSLEKPKDGNYVDAAASSNIMPVHDFGTGKPKRSSYRQKQNSSTENSSDKPTPPLSITEASKVHSDIASNAMISFGSIGNETVSNIEANLSSAHHRKKSRSGKNKHKSEEASKESKDTVESPGESARPKTSESISVQSMPNPTDSNQPLDLHSSSANEGHIRSNNQSKSQHPRRMVKNQGTKSSDKNHGSDAVVWAPVRPQSKAEGSDEPMPSVSVEPSVKGDNLAQNNPRSKRAEMERYIPKPAAKEMSHQGASHQAIVPSNKITSNEAMEPKNGDVRQNKPGKMHGSSTTSPNPSRNFKSSFEDQQHASEWNDGWNMPENPEPVVNVPVLKDPGVSPRGKRYQHKGHKGVGPTHNPEDNHTAGERSTSHWQPRTNKKESARQGGTPLLPRPDKDALSEKTDLKESPDVECHHGPKRERKPVGHKGLPNSNANNCYGRDHESRGEWSGGAGKGYKQESNPNFECQPVGPQNNKSGDFQNPKGYHRNSGPRYRERGQGQPRRGGGNFSGRESGRDGEIC